MTVSGSFTLNEMVLKTLSASAHMVAGTHQVLLFGCLPPNLKVIGLKLNQPSLVANLPASAGDAGPIPGLGRTHRLWSLCPRAKGLYLLKPECLNLELGNRSHAQ